MNKQSSVRELEEALLRAGRSESAPASTRRNVRAALGLAAGAGVGLTAGAAAAGTGAKTGASAVSALVLVKYLMIGAACGALTISGVKLAAPGGRESGPAVVTVASSTPRARPAVVAPVQSATAPEPADSSPPAIRSAAPATPFSSAESKAGSLAAELEWLDRARSALQAHDSAAAIAALDSHAREFPAGQMSLEARVLRIEAIAQSGDRGAASRLAETFVRTHPGSPLTARIRYLLPEMNP